ncbi:GapS4a family protein [Chryseobacterium gambrini]|uniref:GapS4a family protein n=1 Tax=Chryseobacterium gambrini TaxID=373672 RepID=UPI003D0CC6B1
MGEKSKFIGETGEKTVENFLNLIGWNNTSKGIEFPCFYDDHNKERSHGLDFFFKYLSPLVDGVLKKINISVKFTDNKYPSSPNYKFKEHFIDLAESMDCFKFSEHYKEIANTITEPYQSSENIGVLFWLSNKNKVHDEITNKVSNSILPITYNFDSIYLVDNRKLEFIYSSITYAKNLDTSHFLSFFYQDTGKNINPTIKKNFGEILPVEFINSSVLPIRLENPNDKSTKLVLTCIDNFSVDNLKRLISLAQELTKSWPSNVTIGFPDYNATSNSKDVIVAKSAFESNFTKNIKVVSFYPNSKSLQDEA